MSVIDLTYYFVYCFNTVKNTDLPGSVAVNRPADGFGGAKRLYVISVFMYSTVLLMYVDRFINVQNSETRKCIIISVLIFVISFVYFYFGKKEEQIVTHYGTSRSGKEKGDWLKGFIFFCLSIVLMLCSF